MAKDKKGCKIQGIFIEEVHELEDASNKQPKLLQDKAMHGFVLENLESVTMENITLRGLLCWNYECLRITEVYKGLFQNVSIEHCTVVARSPNMPYLSALIVITPFANLNFVNLTLVETVTIIDPVEQIVKQHHIPNLADVAGAMIIEAPIANIYMDSVVIRGSEVRMPINFVVKAVDGILIRCKQLMIVNSKLEWNGQTDMRPLNQPLKRGALSISALLVEIYNISCIGSISYEGGCLSIGANRLSTVNIINATFINNSAVQGAAIYIDSEDSIPFNISITNGSFIGNYAEEGSAFFFSVPTKLSIQNGINKQITFTKVFFEDTSQRFNLKPCPQILLRLDRAIFILDGVELAAGANVDAASYALSFSSETQSSQLGIKHLRANLSQADTSSSQKNKESLFRVKNLLYLKVIDAEVFVSSGASIGSLFEADQLKILVFRKVRMVDSAVTFAKLSNVLNFYLLESNFMNNRAGTLIYQTSSDQSGMSFLINSTFESNNCVGDAILHFNYAPAIRKNESVLWNTTIRDCNFTKNKGMLHGTVYSRHHSLIVENSRFEANKGRFAGAITFVDEFKRSKVRAINTYSLSVHDSEFVENEGFRAGAILCMSTSCQYHHSNFTDNRGRIQSDIAGMPTKIVMLVDESQITLQCNSSRPKKLRYHMINVDDGIIDYTNSFERLLTAVTDSHFTDCSVILSPTEVIDEQILFTLFDADYNPVYRLPASTMAEVYYTSGNKEAVMLEGERDILANQSGIFSFSTLFIFAPRNSSFTIDIRIQSQRSSNLHKAETFVSGEEFVDLRATISIKMRDCISGEFFDKEGFCRNCERGSFSIIPIANTCYPCPTKGEAYCISEKELSVPPTSWRQNNTSHYGFKCKNPTACLGENNCMEGFTGPLCAACSQNEASRSVPTEPYHCSICQTSFASLWDWAKLFGRGITFLVGIVMLVLQIKSAIGVSEKLCVTPFLHLEEGEFRTKRFAGLLWKHVLSYYQLISIFSSFGEFFKGYSMIFSPPFTQVMYFLECYTSLASSDPLQLYLRLMAFSCLAYCLVAFLIMSIFLRKRLRPNFWPSCLTACIVILQNLFPSIITAMAFAQRCNNKLQSAHSIAFMKMDARYLCGTPKHEELTTFALITLIFYCSILLLFLMILTAFQSQLRKPRFRLCLGYFYNDYKDHSFYWEFFRIFQKFILIFLVLQFADDYQNKTLTMTIFLWIYYGLLGKLKPFANDSLNNIDRRVTIIYISTLFLSFYVRENQVLWLRIPAQVVMWAMNLIFVFTMAYLLIRTYLQVSEISRESNLLPL